MSKHTDEAMIAAEALDVAAQLHKSHGVNPMTDKQLEPIAAIIDEATGLPQLKAHHGELVAALEFYAKPENDVGSIAREALAKIKEEK